jgi:hypothetical protein
MKTIVIHFEIPQSPSMCAADSLITFNTRPAASLGTVWVFQFAFQPSPLERNNPQSPNNVRHQSDTIVSRVTVHTRPAQLGVSLRFVER